MLIHFRMYNGLRLSHSKAT